MWDVGGRVSTRLAPAGIKVTAAGDFSSSFLRPRPKVWRMYKKGRKPGGKLWGLSCKQAARVVLVRKVRLPLGEGIWSVYG